MTSVRPEPRAYHAHRGLLLVPPILLAILSLLTAWFERSPQAERLIREDQRIRRLSEDAGDALNRMVQHDGVTWDPTNGTQLERVIGSLRVAPPPRILLVGSSQLITTTDDRSIDSLRHRIDGYLGSLVDPAAAVYNLSVGGMTPGEKAIVVDRATSSLRFDHVLVALTLWDCVREEVRPSIARLPEKVARRPTGSGSVAPGPTSLKPSAVNEWATARVESGLERAIPFFRVRGAIQSWLARGAAEAIGFDSAKPADQRGDGAQASIGASGASPMEYRYTEEELTKAIESARNLAFTIGAVARERRFRATVLFTPVRQDEAHPAYEAKAYERFRVAVARRAEASGVAVIDAYALLDATHFGVYEMGENRGRIDVLHFDAAGHAILAARVAAALSEPRR